MENVRQYMESKPYGKRGYRVYVKEPGFFYVRKAGLITWTWVELTQTGKYLRGSGQWFDGMQDAARDLLTTYGKPE